MGKVLTRSDMYGCTGDAQQVASIREWATWSSVPHSEEEIREKRLTDFKNVCFTFLCEKSKMSCDFIEELMSLSTGVLTKENYEEMYEKVHRTVLSHNGVDEVQADKWSIDEEDTQLKSIKESSSTKTISSSSVNDRIDWLAICRYQVLTEDFMRKFNKKLIWREIKLHQKLSDSFKEDFKKQLSLQEEQ